MLGEHPGEWNSLTVARRLLEIALPRLVRWPLLLRAPATARRLWPHNRRPRIVARDACQGSGSTWIRSAGQSIAELDSSDSLADRLALRIELGCPCPLSLTPVRKSLPTPAADRAVNAITRICRRLRHSLQCATRVPARHGKIHVLQMISGFSPITLLIPFGAIKRQSQTLNLSE
jgi:hypothetical protein